MANTIKLKRGSGSDPSASDLSVGEIAIRTDSGKLFTKKDNGSVAEISGSGGIDDGDKGDITVSNGGDTFTIDNGVVTSAKIADGTIVNADISGSAAIAGSKLQAAGLVNAGSMSAANFNKLAGIEANATADMTGSEILSTISGENIILGEISSTGNSSFAGNVTISSSDGGSAAAPELDLYRISASPADADYLGQIKFSGESDDDSKEVYAKITGKIGDASSGTEDGIIEIAHRKAGSNNISARFTSTDLKLINGTGLEVAGDTTLSGNLGVGTAATSTEFLFIETPSGSSGNNTTKGGLRIKDGAFANGALIECQNSVGGTVFKVGGDLVTTTSHLDVGAGLDVTGNISCSGTVDGVDIATRDTLFGGLTSSSGVLSNGVTATTQSASDNSTKVATTAYTDTAIANLIDSSPSTLNTLNELASALGDDPNFATTVTNSIATKMPLAGGTFSGNLITRFIVPDNDSQRDLGTTSVRWRAAYVDNYYGSGANLTNLPSQTDNNFTDADHSKLDGIESNATADQTASEILTLIKTVDGAGSGLDADTLDGVNSNQFLRSNVTTTFNANGNDFNFESDGSRTLIGFQYNGSLKWQLKQQSTGENLNFDRVAGSGVFQVDGNRVLTTADEGSGNGIDADTLDGQEGSYYTNASNLGSGTIPAARVPTLNQNTTGSAATLTTARTIAGTSFDGSANIDISYANLTNKLSVGDGGLTQKNFTTTLKNKLDGIASGATNVTNNNQLTNGAGYITATLTNEQVQDIVGGMVSSNTESGITVTYQDGDGTLDFSVASQTDNNFTNADHSKLDGIEAGATADQTASEILTLIKTVDGAGSGLDADTLDGISSASFMRSDANDTTSGSITLSQDGTDVINFSANSTNDNRGIAFNSRTAVSADYNDGWLRLNNGGEFSNGVYTPGQLYTAGVLRADGGVNVDGATVINGSGIIVASKVPTLNQNTTGSSGSCTGNAATATKLATARTIAGVSFDGSANISLNNNAITNGAGYVTSSVINSLNASNLSSGTIPDARFPSTLPAVDGSNLTGISAGATGGGSDECFYENDQNVTTNYTITNGRNAMAAGPLTINSGVTVTVGSGETLTIV